MTDVNDRKGIWSDEIDDSSSEEENTLRGRPIHQQYSQSFGQFRNTSIGPPQGYAPRQPSRLSSYSVSVDPDSQVMEGSTSSAAESTNPSPASDRSEAVGMRPPYEAQGTSVVAQQHQATPSTTQQPFQQPLISEGLEVPSEGLGVPGGKKKRKLLKPWSKK